MLWNIKLIINSANWSSSDHKCYLGMVRPARTGESRKTSWVKGEPGPGKMSMVRQKLKKMRKSANWSLGK